MTEQEIARVVELEAERDFLLDRSSRAGKASFSGERWTGVSSNALVTVAFGGEDASLPSDGQDLAACYRTMQRLPKHLLSDRLLDQLDEGEKAVAKRHPNNLTWAQEVTGWDAQAVRRHLEAQGDKGGAGHG